MKGLSKIVSKEKRINIFRHCILLFVFGQFYGNAVLSFCYGFLVIGTLINIDSLKKREKTTTLAAAFFFILFSFYTLSSAINSYEFKEFVKVEKLSAFIIFPLIFLSAKNLFREQNFVNRCKYTYFTAANISIIILLIIAMINSINHSSMIYFTYNELTNPLGIQPIYYGAFYCLAIIFGFDLLSVFKKYEKIIIFGIFLLSVAVILVASRTSWVILMIILPVKIGPILSKNKKSVLMVMVFLFSILILILNNPTIKNRLLKSNSNVSSYSGLSFRLKIWKNTADLISKKPILGYGPYNAELELQNKFLKENFRRAYFLKLNVHNQYLQTFLETGVFGLLILLLLLLLFLYNSKGDTGKLLFLMLICLSLLTESYFRRFNGVLFFCYFYFFFLSIEPTVKKLTR